MSRARSDRSELMEALQGAMRRLSDGVNLYESAVAERLGMHPTDLHFLGLVQLYGPTTAGHLAELGALTTGAVTGVLDRLEQAGYVRREPDPEDRRRVVVRLIEDSMSTVSRLYDPLRAASATVSERYSDDDLATILDYADRLRPLVQEQASTLRAGTARPVHRARGEGADATTSLSAPVAGLTAATLRFPRGAGHLVVRGDPSLDELFRAEFLSSVATAKVDRGVVNVQYRKSPFGLACQARRAEAQHLGCVAGGAGRGLHPLRRTTRRRRHHGRHGDRRCQPRVDRAAGARGHRPDPCHRWGERPHGHATGRDRSGPQGAGRRGQRELRRPALGRGRRQRQLAQPRGRRRRRPLRDRDRRRSQDARRHHAAA